jgi:class 3 adenylate cyclase/tetratricopeptide (TPR) repeat protein
MDAEDFRDLINEYQAVCEESVTEFGGHVAQYLGDGVMVYFGFPEAHEDDPRRATGACLAILKRVESIQERLHLKLPLPPQVRIGVHTGVVVVDQLGGGREPLALGEVPNLAARLQQLAEPGTVLISDATRRLIEGFFVIEPLGEKLVKGYESPVPLFQLLASTGAQSRIAATGPHLTPFVGRESEMQSLEAQWALCQQSQSLRCVSLVGEPGIGKSRHVQTFKASLPRALHLLEGYCSALHGNAVLAPIAQALEANLELSAVPSEQRFRQLQIRLAKLDVDGNAAAFLAPLLSIQVPAESAPLVLAPQVRRQRTMQALVHWLEGLARTAPVLFVIEDLHWADPSTAEFLSKHVAAARGPILILATSRVEGTLASLPAATLVSVQRLGPAHAEKLVQTVAGGQLPPAVLAHIVDLTDGVPLYLEEVTKALLESGALQIVNGEYQLSGPLPEGVLPATVHDSLMARLDRMGEAKAVAQLAATLGREFSHEVLKTVALIDESALNAALRRLTESGLMLEVDATPSRSFRFKHALIQEAAYQSLLKSRRQQYHHRIASVLRDQFPETAERYPHVIAVHHSKAGLPSIAAQYFQRAGVNALAAQAYTESTSHFRAALEELQRVNSGKERDRTELEILAGLGLPLLMTKGYAAPEVESTYGRALKLCAEVEPPLRVLYGVWVVQAVRSDYAKTLLLVEHFTKIVSKGANSAEKNIALSAIGVRAFWRGRFHDAIEVLSKAVSHFEDHMLTTLSRDYGYDNPLYSHLLLAWSQYMVGDLTAGQETWNEVVRVTELGRSPYLEVMTLSFGAAIAHDLGDARTVLERSQRGLTIAAEHQLVFWLALAQMQHGAALAALGEIRHGIAEMERGLSLFRATGAVAPLPYYLCYLAEGYLAAGDLAKGLETVQEGLRLTESIVDRNCTPELLRLEGELLVKKGLRDEAEDCFRRALEVAQTDGAGLWKLRSSIPYARSRWARGRAEQALDILAKGCSAVRGKDACILASAAELKQMIEADMARVPPTQ